MTLFVTNAGKMVDYRFVAVNRAFEEMTGLRAAEVLGKRVLEVLPDTESIWMERYGHVALTGESAAFESFSVALNKTYEVKAYRTRPGQFAVMMQDVSARGAAERALAGERALLRRVIDAIPDLIFFKDAAGRYMGCNKAFEAFAGRDEQAQVGKTDFDFFDHKTASFFREQDRRMMEGGETRQNEEWVTYPDGRQVLLNTVKTPFGNVRGEAAGVLGISRDITAQFQVQADLKARDETYRAMLSTAVDGFWIVRRPRPADRGQSRPMHACQATRAKNCWAWRFRKLTVLTHRQLSPHARNASSPTAATCLSPSIAARTERSGRLKSVQISGRSKAGFLSSSATSRSASWLKRNCSKLQKCSKTRRTA
jgi:PAS domain S-box-containing protein